MNLRNHCAPQQVGRLLRLPETASQKQRLREDVFPATTR